MKRTKIIKVLFGIIVLSSIFLIASCDKDLYENSFQKENKNITVSHISLSDLEKDICSKITSRIKEVNELNSKAEKLSRFEYNSELDLYIDTDNGTLVDKDGKFYYTFPMYRESEENLENIIFTPDDSGEFETFIAKYNITPEEFNELTLEEKETLTPQFQKVYYNNLILVCTELSYVISIYPNCTHTGGDHGNGVFCQTESVTYVYKFCSVIENDNGGGDSPDYSGNPGGNYDDGSSTGGDDEISTSPVGISPKQLIIKKFKKQLAPNQQNCFNSLTPDKQQALENFLNPTLEEDCDGNTYTDEQQFEFLEQLLAELCAGGQTAEDAWNGFKDRFLINVAEGSEYDTGADLDVLFYNFPPQQLPTFSNFFSAFPSHTDAAFDTSQELYTSIGGQVLTAYNAGARNTCALRISKALIGSGIQIPYISNKTKKGADNNNYFMMAKDLLVWMKETFGTPTGGNHLLGCQGGLNGVNFKSLLQGKQGIYIMIPNDPSSQGFEASGHADLYSYNDCDGYCYFNATGGVKEIFFWELP